MPRITELYAWVAEDGGPDDEGVAAMQTDLGIMPLVGADRARVTSLKETAALVARVTGRTLRLYRFPGERQLLDVVEP